MLQLYEIESVVRGYYVYGPLQLVQRYPAYKKGLIHTIVTLLGFTALLTASIHDNGTELANNPLELGKTALSHVSNMNGQVIEWSGHIRMYLL